MMKTDQLPLEQWRGNINMQTLFLLFLLMTTAVQEEPSTAVATKGSTGTGENKNGLRPAAGELWSGPLHLPI